MTNTEFHTRPLTADDLERVIDIDAQYVGRRRDGFYRKRLEAALADPGGFAYLACDVDGTLQGYLLARLQDGEYGTAGRSASMDAIGVDSASGSKGMGRSLLAALDEILRHKGIGVVYTQAEWSNLPMLRFFAGTEFSLAPRYILERDAGYLDDLEFADDLIEEAGRLGDPNDYSDAEGDQRGALVRDIVPCRAMQRADLASIVRIDRKISGKDNETYYEQKMAEVFGESGIRVSLVAEQDDHVVGFAMASYTHHLVGTALLSQLLANLATLRIEVVRSEADADHFDVLQFLQRNGFTNSQRLAFTRDVGK